MFNQDPKVKNERKKKCEEVTVEVATLVNDGDLNELSQTF